MNLANRFSVPTRIDAALSAGEPRGPGRQIDTLGASHYAMNPGTFIYLISCRPETMPTSHPSQIPTLLSVILKSNASSFLEIGPGFGKWGVLIREYVDISDGREKYDKADWRCTIDCIEAFPKYITPLHRFVYDAIHEGDASQIVPTLDRRYDLALMIDVLEHFTFEAGSALLRELRQRSRGILISAPKDNGEQSDAFGNVWETHRHLWTRRELSAFGPSISIRNDKSTIVYIGDDAKRIAARVHLARWGLEQIALRTVARFRSRGSAGN